LATIVARLATILAKILELLLELLLLLLLLLLYAFFHVFIRGREAFHIITKSMHTGEAAAEAAAAPADGSKSLANVFQKEKYFEV